MQGPFASTMKTCKESACTICLWPTAQSIFLKALTGSEIFPCVDQTTVKEVPRGHPGFTYFITDIAQLSQDERYATMGTHSRWEVDG